MVSPRTLLTTAFAFSRPFCSSFRLMLKNCSILHICFCIRQQPQEAWSARHTVWTQTHRQTHRTKDQTVVLNTPRCLPSSVCLVSPFLLSLCLTVLCFGVLCCLSRAIPAVFIGQSGPQQAQQYDSCRREQSKSTQLHHSMHSSIHCTHTCSVTHHRRTGVVHPLGYSRPKA